jgi:hypothetical protein
MANPAAGSVVGPVAYDGAGSLGIGYQSSAFVGTVLIEGTVDSQTWYPLGQANLSISAATQDEDWMAVPAGFALVRARVTAFTSGSLVLTLEANGNSYAQEWDEYRQTYEAALNGVALGTTAFDQALFTPPAATAGKKVNAYIKELEVIYHGATAAGSARLAWQMESVAQTGGTLGTAPAVAVMDNIIDAAASSTLKQYTTQPTGGGTVLAVVAAGLLGVAGAIGAAPSQIWTKPYLAQHAKALVVRPGNFLALNSPAAAAAGSVASVRVKWQERSW